MRASQKHIAVIGTGVSGLRVAQLLVKNQSHVISKITLIEKETQIGGVLKHSQQGEFLFEHGAQGVLSSQESFSQCVSDLNLKPQMIVPKSKKLRRYLLTPTGYFGLFPGFFIFLRVICELFIKKSEKPIPNETIYDFFARRFGKKFTDKLVVPLTFGIWAGGAKKILMRYAFPKLQKIECASGSLIKYFLFHLFSKRKRAHLCSFSQGMHALPQALYDDLKKQCLENGVELVTLMNTSVVSLYGDSNTGVICSLHTTTQNELNPSKGKNQTKECVFDLVVYSGQPWRDPDLVVGQDKKSQEAWANLKNIPSYSIAVVGLGGQTSSDHMQGFGALANLWSQDILGVLSVHSIYPQHVPCEKFLYRVMLGGEMDPQIWEKSKPELVSLSKQRLFEMKILDASHTTFEFEDVVVWKDYIPISTEDQDQVLASLWRLEACNPGLFFTGNYTHGVGVADCLRSAGAVVEKIKSTYLNY